MPWFFITVSFVYGATSVRLIANDKLQGSKVLSQWNFKRKLVCAILGVVGLLLYHHRRITRHTRNKETCSCGRLIMFATRMNPERRSLCPCTQNSRRTFSLETHWSKSSIVASLSRSDDSVSFKVRLSIKEGVMKLEGELAAKAGFTECTLH